MEIFLVYLEKHKRIARIIGNINDKEVFSFMFLFIQKNIRKLHR